MNYLNRWFQYSIYRNMILYFNLLVAVIIILISTSLFYFFARSTSIEISRMSNSMLSQTSYSANIIREQTLIVGNQLINDNNMISVMYSKESDPVHEYQAIRTLSNIQSIYSFIREISIYNEYTDRFITRRGSSSKVEDEPLLAKLKLFDGMQYMEIFPRKTIVKKGASEEAGNLISIILHPNFTSSHASKSAIIIDIDEKYIQNLMLSMKNNSETNIFITDHQGTVISHTNPQLILSNIAEEPYMEKILKLTDSQGYFSKTFEGEQKLITYVKSAELDWYFVSVQSYKKMLPNIISLKTFTLLIGIIIFSLGLLVSLWVLNKMYNPLKSLMKRVTSINLKKSDSQNEFGLLSDAFSSLIDKSNQMEIVNQASYPVLKGAYLRLLFKGALNDGSYQDQVIQELQQQFDAPYFCVLVIKIDKYQKFQKDNSMKMQALYRFSIHNIARELLEKHEVCDSVSMEENEIAVLISQEKEVLAQDVVLSIAELQKVIFGYFKFTVTVGVGPLVKTKEEFSYSYKSAIEYINYRLFLGFNHIIDFNRIKQQSKNLVKYPQGIEKKIIDAIQLNNKKLMEIEIAHFMDIVREANYYQALTYCNQFLISLLKTFDPTLEMMSADSNEYYEVMENLSTLETIEDISISLSEFCNNICELMEKKNHYKNYEIIEFVQRHLQEHYRNPDLSLDYMADKVQISSGYLGKLFRSFCSVSFNDYLKNIRLEKAADLVKTTEESSTWIGEQVGIPNNTYFLTLFKKKYGMSPSQFRSLSLSQRKEE